MNPENSRSRLLELGRNFSRFLEVEPGRGLLRSLEVEPGRGFSRSLEVGSGRVERRFGQCPICNAFQALPELRGECPNCKASRALPELRGECPNCKAPRALPELRGECPNCKAPGECPNCKAIRGANCKSCVHAEFSRDFPCVPKLRHAPGTPRPRNSRAKNAPATSVPHCF